MGLYMQVYPEVGLARIMQTIFAWSSNKLETVLVRPGVYRSTIYNKSCGLARIHCHRDHLECLCLELVYSSNNPRENIGNKKQKACNTRCVRGWMDGLAIVFVDSN